MCNLPRSLLSDMNNHVSTSAGLTSELGFSQVFAEESCPAKGEQRAWCFGRCGQPPSACDCIWPPYLCVFRAKTSVSGVLTVDGWYGLIRETFRACPESCSKGVGGNPLAVVSLMTSPTSGARSTSPHREEGWTCPVAQHGLDEG